MLLLATVSLARQRGVCWQVAALTEPEPSMLLGRPPHCGLAAACTGCMPLRPHHEISEKMPLSFVTQKRPCVIVAFTELSLPNISPFDISHCQRLGVRIFQQAFCMGAWQQKHVS